MGKFLLIISCFLSLNFFAFGQKTLTLDDALNIALQRNTSLQKAVNNIKTYESNLKAAYGNLLPTVGATGSWNWTHSVDEKGGTYNFGSIVINTPKTITESRNYSAGASANWTLFDGLSNYTNVSKNKNDLESARLSLERTKQDIVFQTITYYYSVLNTQQLLKVSEEDVKWNKQNLETIVERNKLGAVTLADVYSQQVKEGNAELAVIQARNNFETAKSNLLYYLGLDVLTDYNYSDSLNSQEQDILKTDVSSEYNDISKLVNEALENRTDYKSAKLDLESAYNSVTIAEGSYYPRLTNSINYDLRANSLSDLSKSRTYSVGLTLSVPIFEGFSVDNQVQLAEVNAENKKVDLDDLQRTIKSNLQKTYLDLQAAKKALDVNKRNVTSAEESRKIEQNKYELGSSTLLNVLIANSDYITAQTNYINSQFDFIKLYGQLKYYLGVLNFKKYE